jgi:hypothetical protein
VTPEIERLIVEEDRAWSTLHALFERVPASRFDDPDVTSGGWSAKDVMFHVGAWLAEASRQLERIREGTYEPPRLTSQALNEEWFALSRTLDLVTVRAELEAGRVMARETLGTLAEVTPLAREWFEESGVLHYTEHAAGLERWLGA